MKLWKIVYSELKGNLPNKSPYPKFIIYRVDSDLR